MQTGLKLSLCLVGRLLQRTSTIKETRRETFFAVLLLLDKRRLGAKVNRTRHRTDLDSNGFLKNSPYPFIAYNTNIKEDESGSTFGRMDRYKIWQDGNDLADYILDLRHILRVFNSVLGRLTGQSSPTEEDNEAKEKEFEANFTELQERCQVLFTADPKLTMTDSSLKRFLKAFISVDSAFHHIVKYNKWREDYGVDHLTSEDPDILTEMATMKAHLLRIKDNKGRPILYVAARKHIANEKTMDRAIKYTVYMLEQACQRIDESTIDNLCLVFDLKGFTMSNMDYGYTKSLIQLLGRYYPERLGICLMINSPVFFSGCWTVIRPWLNEVTASKVTFVPNEEQLCKYLNPDSLPPNED